MKFLRHPYTFTAAMILAIIACSGIAWGINVAAGIAAAFLTIVLLVYWIVQLVK